VIKCLRNTGKR